MVVLAVGKTLICCFRVFHQISIGIIIICIYLEGLGIWLPSLSWFSHHWVAFGIRTVSSRMATLPSGKKCIMA